MFTGLVESTGIISLCQRQGDLMELGISPAKAISPVHGESIAVNGCCLTIADLARPYLYFHVSGETLAKTNFATLATGMAVNLERAMRVGDRLGGHMVSGHVDGVARIMEIQDDPSFRRMSVLVPKPLHRYLIPKGSICLDGVSLTVNMLRDTDDGSLVELTLIPTTLAETTLGRKKRGDTLNVEMDLIGKYVDRFNNVF